MKEQHNLSDKAGLILYPAHKRTDQAENTNQQRFANADGQAEDCKHKTDHRAEKRAGQRTGSKHL